MNRKGFNMSTDRSNRAVSTDGTEIAYWTSGNGPPLALVHGGDGDHTRWAALRPHLERRLTEPAHALRRMAASEPRCVFPAVLERQTHLAAIISPALVAAQVRAFLER
jgi:pimeloyl-ACP methyl ester carboxylesterase